MPFIILDRDGVINFDSDFYIKTPEEFLPIPGSLEAIAKLNRAGYHVLVATNQSGIARGYYDLPMLHRIHDKLRAELKKVGGVVEEIFFCPHHPDEKCACRKPQPGMFYDIQKKYGIHFADVFFIGDSLTDMHVAEVVGCKPILVLTSKGEKTLKNNPELSVIPQYANLAEAVDAILSVPSDSN
ncbi:MAG: D-glycero-beta-D-manno-heptose 1,7-bisphosphate 7-phosphatase [Gammaproteobacteria bacterium]|nr:D-glycero-beta-D-manno-heptose 1,7-bisphosphate 7-phosphatase [Gammaproteobacteria bacterium]